VKRKKMGEEEIRKKLIEKLMWNEGGSGYGICSVAGMMLHTMTDKSSDIPSIVAIGGSPDDYTTEELEKLVRFSSRMTEDYDTRYRDRQGANLIIIHKIEKDHWIRKRMSWEIGPMFSETLDEAIAIFEN
jgi:hypothetical protein